MSRPFSYNSESFTVIGNMLFIHKRYDHRVFPGTIIEDVPTEIGKRLYHKESYLMMVNTKSLSDTVLVPVSMRYNMLTTREGVPTIPAVEEGERWYYGMYFLKDI